MTDTIKLQKFMADAGIASRRKAEEMIRDGRVSVSGTLAHIGMRVKPNARISVDDKLVSANSDQKPRLIIYHKPPGEVCTRSDPEGRPTVFDNLPELEDGQGRWIIVGRLDYHTTGLLLFTNDGELANKYMHPSSELDREYRVRVIGEVTDDMIKNMRKGVELEDGVARFDKIRATGSAGGKNTWFQVVLKEGRNRIVRRLWESQNITVSRLMRVRFGEISLPRELKKGEWKDIAATSL